MSARATASLRSRAPQLLALALVLYPASGLHHPRLDYLYSEGGRLAMDLVDLLTGRLLALFPLPHELLLPLAALCAVVARPWVPWPRLRGAAALPAIALELFVVFLGAAIAPAAALVGLGALLLLPGGLVEDHRLRWWELASLVVAVVLLALVLQGVGDVTLDSLAAGFGALSSRLGSAWQAVAVSLGLGVLGWELWREGAPQRRRAGVAVGALIVLPLLDRVLGPGFGIGPSVASAALINAGAAAYRRRGFRPLAPWAPAPPLVARALLPWAFVGLVATSQGYLFGAWDCGAVDRAEGVRRLSDAPGAFQALLYPDGERVLVSYRAAERLVLYAVDSGRALAELDVAEVLDGESWARVGPEILVWTPHGVAAILSVPDREVGNPLLLLDPDTLTVRRRSADVDCEEITDLVPVSGDQLLGICPSASADEAIDALIRLDAATLRELDRVPLEVSIDRFALLPGEEQGLWTALTEGGPHLFDLRTGTEQVNDNPGGFTFDLALGDGGRVAFVSRYLFGEVLRYDPPSLEARSRQRVGYGARALGCGGGRCYVASAVTGRLHRVWPPGQPGSWPVGGHARRMAVSREGVAYVAGDCGLVEVR